MIRSMTGYGRGEASNSDATVVVELRSVNNRFRDIQLRCPREYLPLEPRINNLLKDPFQRGRIDAFIRRTVATAPTRVVGDRSLAKQYASAIRELASEIGTDETPPLEFILAQPGVIDVADEEVDVMAEWDVLETALQSAIDDLLSMREVEGKALYRDIGTHLAEMRRLIVEVEAASEGVNERIRQRLEQRIRRLLGERYEPVRVVQEAALLADKSDVAEELARLRSHCDQLAESLESPEPVGRRLDFLLQEMNREVNTIGSKAAEHPVSHKVVDMKSVLERMREQAANVE